MSTTGGEAEGAAETQAETQAEAQCSTKVIKACRDLLMDLRIRSMIGSYMMYDQSDKYSRMSFWMLIGASGIMGVAAGGLSLTIPIGKGRIPLISKIAIGMITGSSSTFTAGSMLLHETFEEKQKLFNKTGAKWQELELNIRYFLDTTEVKDKTDKYENFTKECIKQRCEICYMAKPEREVYAKYNEQWPSIVAEQYEKKRNVVASIRAELKKEESSQ